jgi:hypothetical protein
MSRARRCGRLCALAVALSVATALSAQAPVVNARVERRTPSQGLAREIQAAVERGGATWVGYTVPILRRTEATPQSTGWCCGRCRLEPPTELLVLVRTEAKAISEVRSLGVDCDMDAGGMPLIWLERVNPDESAAWLASLVTSAPTPPSRDRRSDAALSALAQHATPAAVAPLVRAAREGTSAPLRTRALSALAQRAASEALPAIDAAIEKDPDRQVRRQAVVALSRLPHGEGIPRLMQLARTHGDPEIRRQAMLALGDSRDPRALEFLAAVLQ